MYASILLFYLRTSSPIFDALFLVILPNSVNPQGTVRIYYPCKRYYKAILSARDHATKQVLAGRHDHDRYKSTTVCSPTAIHFHRLAAHHTCND